MFPSNRALLAADAPARPAARTVALAVSLAALPSGPYETASLLAGYCSIACWLCVFTPQLLKNYYRKSGESLSVPFLVIWLLGDIFNVAGVLLQGLLSTMLGLALYYTFADIGLILQVYYYRRCKPADWEEVLTEDDCHSYRGPVPNCSDHAAECRNSPVRYDSLCTTSLQPKVQATAAAEADGSFSGPAFPHLHHSHLHHQNCRSVSPTPEEPEPKRRCMPYEVVYGVVGFLIGCLLLLGFLRTDSRPPGDEAESGGRYLAHFYRSAVSVAAAGARSAALPDNDNIDPLAQMLGWVSAALYVGSRVPQMMKNFRSNTCEGLSFSMFAMAVMGNVTYTLSILILLPAISAGELEGSENVKTYITETLPWLAGSAGTLVFDFIILTQFFLYRHKPPPADEEQNETTRLLREDGRQL